MKSEKIQKIIAGLKLSSIVIVPIYIILIGIDALMLQKVINFSQAQYAIYDYFLLSLVVIGFAGPVIYWVIKKRLLSILGSVLGGAFVIVFMQLIWLFLSCTQGTCF